MTGPVLDALFVVWGLWICWLLVGVCLLVCLFVCCCVVCMLLVVCLLFFGLFVGSVVCCWFVGLGWLG